MKQIIVVFSILFSFTFFSLLGFEKDPNQHFTWRAETPHQFVKQGTSFEIKLFFEFEAGWYIYDLIEQLGPEGLGPQKTEISLYPVNYLKITSNIKTPKPKVKFDSAFFIDIRTFSGKFTFDIPVVALKDIDFSKKKIFVKIYLQQCKDNICLPGSEFQTNIIYKGQEYKGQETYNTLSTTESTDSILMNSIDKGTSVITKKEDTSEQTITSSQEEIESVKKQGLVAYLLFAMTAGALALLTPCVFPMIPITVSFFTKRAEKNPGKGLIDSTVYGLGIILTFTALGFILAFFFGASGIQNFATNPYLNLIIALIFILFSFNLFGTFEFQLPTSLLNKLNTKSQGSGILSVLLMGLTFSLTSFTCTVPFVGVALVSAAGGEWFYPIIGMLGFSFIFAIPFFFLALFPSAIRKFPRSGAWMNNIKVVMGILEIAAAIKFISNADLVWGLGIMPRELFLAIWIASSILIGLYILGIFRLKHDTQVESVGSIRIVFAIFFFSISFYLLSGLFGNKLGELDAFLPPPDYHKVISNESFNQPTPYANSTKVSNNPKKQDEWLEDYQTALQISQNENRPLFIDFSGFTCTNCRWMELNMFTKSEVKQLLDQMVKLRLFTDRREEPYISNKKFQMERFNSIELPLYAILTPNEQVIATSTFTRNLDEFVNFLKKAFN
ncbi:MAG: cytochrome c biogenesis protein CcdA [Candidatus Kapaibacteriales bacterium]